MKHPVHDKLFRIFMFKITGAENAAKNLHVVGVF